MSWGLVWSERARKDLRRLDRQAADRVVRALERYAETEHGDVKRLQHVDPPTWRIRVGELRVLVRLVEGQIRVQRVLPRASAYRD